MLVLVLVLVLVLENDIVEQEGITISTLVNYLSFVKLCFFVSLR